MCFLVFTSLKLISAKQRVPNFRTPAIGKIAKTYWATNSDTPLGQSFTTISWVTMRRWHQILSCGPRWSFSTNLNLVAGNSPFSSYPPPLVNFSKKSTFRTALPFKVCSLHNSTCQKSFTKRPTSYKPSWSNAFNITGGFWRQRLVRKGKEGDYCAW